MAHRHDLAILKSSASYFYRGDRSSRGEGYKLVVSPFFFLPWGHACSAIRWTDWAEQRKREGGNMKDRELEKSAPSDGLSQTDKWFICFGFASAALLTSTSLRSHFTTSDYQELFSPESHAQVLKSQDFLKTGYKKKTAKEQREALREHTSPDYLTFCYATKRDLREILSPDTSDLFSEITDKEYTGRYCSFPKS